jgi:hypothetical protein
MAFCLFQDQAFSQPLTSASGKAPYYFQEEGHKLLRPLPQRTTHFMDHFRLGAGGLVRVGEIADGGGPLSEWFVMATPFSSQQKNTAGQFDNHVPLGSISGYQVHSDAANRVWVSLGPQQFAHQGLGQFNHFDLNLPQNQEETNGLEPYAVISNPYSTHERPRIIYPKRPDLNYFVGESVLYGSAVGGGVDMNPFLDAQGKRVPNEKYFTDVIVGLPGATDWAGHQWFPHYPFPTMFAMEQGSVEIYEVKNNKFSALASFRGLRTYSKMGQYVGAIGPIDGSPYSYMGIGSPVRTDSFEYILGISPLTRTLPAELKLIRGYDENLINVPAQNPLFQRPALTAIIKSPPGTGGHFGTTFAPFHDVNGGGPYQWKVPEFLVGNRSWRSSPAAHDTGKVYIMKGGPAIYSPHVTDDLEKIRFPHAYQRIALNYWNGGDPWNEIDFRDIRLGEVYKEISAEDVRNEIQALNPPATFTRIADFGKVLENIGDFNCDGYDDFAVSSGSLELDGNHKGFLSIHSGRPAQRDQYLRIRNEDNEFLLPNYTADILYFEIIERSTYPKISKIGDINTDGCADIAVLDGTGGMALATWIPGVLPREAYVRIVSGGPSNEEDPLTFIEQKREGNSNLQTPDHSIISFSRNFAGGQGKTLWEKPTGIVVSNAFDVPTDIVGGQTYDLDSLEEAFYLALSYPYKDSNQVAEDGEVKKTGHLEVLANFEEPYQTGTPEGIMGEDLTVSVSADGQSFSFSNQDHILKVDPQDSHLYIKIDSAHLPGPREIYLFVQEGGDLRAQEVSSLSTSTGLNAMLSRIVIDQNTIQEGEIVGQNSTHYQIGDVLKIDVQTNAPYGKNYFLMAAIRDYSVPGGWRLSQTLRLDLR